MAYNDNGDWVYEHDVPNNGDPVRIAGIVLCRAIESYLFDFKHPGYNKPEFLEWSRAQYEVNRSSTGTHANVNALQWDPTKTEYKVERDKSVSYTPAGQVDFGIKTTAPNFGDKAEIGEAQIYAPHEVADPNLARFRNGNAVVVNERDARDFIPAEVAPDKFAADEDGDA